MVAKMRSRKDLKEQLLKRGEESYTTKDDSGKFGTIFRKDLSGVKFWKCGEGEHQIDIIPWFAGKQYPTKNYPNLNEGDPVYWLDVWVHYGIGAEENQVVCLQKNYDEPCPICEDVTILSKEEDPNEELIDSIKAKRRGIYNIICWDSAAEEEKGVQVWNVAHFSFEKKLSEISEKPEGGGYVCFADPDEGKTIFFKRKGMGQKSTEYIALQFLDRKVKIEDADLEDAEKQCLDEMVVVLSYDDIYRLHHGSSKEDGPRSTPVERPQVEPPPSEGTPVGRRRRPQEEPDKQPEDSKTTGDEKCPGGGQFGRSIDTLGEACDQCELWDNCGAEAQRLEKEAKQQPQTKTEEPTPAPTSRRRRRPV